MSSERGSNSRTKEKAHTKRILEHLSQFALRSFCICL